MEVPIFCCWIESLYFCELGAHTKFRNPTTYPSGRSDIVITVNYYWNNSEWDLSDQSQMNYLISEQWLKAFKIRVLWIETQVAMVLVNPPLSEIFGKLSRFPRSEIFYPTLSRDSAKYTNKLYSSLTGPSIVCAPHIVVTQRSTNRLLYTESTNKHLGTKMFLPNLKSKLK